MRMRLHSITNFNAQNYIPFNKYYIYNWISFNITRLNYSFNFAFNIIKIEYWFL